jgi:WD40 repeat protein
MGSADRLPTPPAPTRQGPGAMPEFPAWISGGIALSLTTVRRPMNPRRLLFSLLALPLSWVCSQDGPPRLLIDSKGHSGKVNKVLFRTTTNELISLGDDKTIRFWDIHSGELVRTMRGEIGDGDGELFAGALSKDDRYLAVGGFDPEDTIRVIDLEIGKVCAVLRGHGNSINSLDFSDDGNWLASGSSDKTIRIWNLSALREATPVLDLTEAEVIDVQDDSVYEVDFGPDGLFLVSSAGAGRIVLWKRADDTSGFSSLAELSGHEDNVSALAFSPAGGLIASGGRDKKLVLWDGETGERLKVLDEDMGETVTAVAFSPDGKRLLASSHAIDAGTTAIYDLKTGARTVEFFGHTNRVRAVAWHPEENLVVSAGGDRNEICLWHPDPDKAGGADAGTLVHQLVGEGSTNWAVAFSDDREGVVAFGRSNSPDKEVLEEPLELAFDFLNFEFVNAGEFTRTFTEIESVTLEQREPNLLTIGEGNSLATHPRMDGRIRSFSFSADGSAVFVGSDFTLKSHASNPDDQGNREVLHQFIGHHSEVWAISLSRDGRYLASASGDQTVRLWNAATGELLASLFVAEDLEWVCWTPSGYYHASPGGERFIGWHFNHGVGQLGEFFPCYVFRDACHQPELVRQTILLGSAGAAMTETGTEPLDLDLLLPPRIEWVSPKRARGSHDGTTFTVRAELHSPNGELQELKVLLNGKALVGYDLSDGTKLSFEEEIELNPGENRLALFARNIHAGHTSEERVIRVEVPEPEEAPDQPAGDGLDELTKPNLYVLSVGVSTFADADISALEYCDNDATAMAEFFAGQEGGLFRKTEVKRLVNEEATEAAIQEGLDWLEKSATQKDFVILFLASHGCNDEKGNFYMIPHDCDPENLRATGVAWEDFGEILGNLPSRVLMFLDTCHSGRLGANLFTMANGSKTRSFNGLKSAFDNTEAIRELTSDEVGVVIMAASTGNESSLENEEWGHGAFTTAALAGLRGEADLNDDGIVHLVELDFFVAEKVKELTEGAQHPTTVKPSTISRLPVAAVAE